MTGFYEEMADFAAMSEDDGFLGQCAGELPEPMAASTFQPASSLSGIAPVHRGPQQLQLLLIPRADGTRTV